MTRSMRYFLVVVASLLALLMVVTNMVMAFGFADERTQNQAIAAASRRADRLQCEAGNDTIDKIRTVLEALASRTERPVETQRFLAPILSSKDLQPNDCSKFTEPQ